MEQPIPFFGLDRQYRRYRDDFLAITDQVLSRGQVLQGPEVAAFESALAAGCGRQFGVTVGSCTDALAFALLACGIGPGDEVLVTTFSFVASLTPILRVGATPRFVDVATDDAMMDLDRLVQAITPRCRAILAVHLYGQTLDMTRIEAIAKEYGLMLIEDAAQALGADDHGRPAGSMGRVSCLSFDPTKVIGSFSSAGALVTDDPEIARLARMLRYHGRDPITRTYALLGYNSQLSTEMAAMLAFKLAQLPVWLAERRLIAQRYLDGLAGLPAIQLPKCRPGSSHVWHKFVIRVQNRDALAEALQKVGIQTLVHYATPLCDEPLVSGLASPAEGEQARLLAGSVLSLPIFPELSLEEVDRVIFAIRSFYAHA